MAKDYVVAIDLGTSCTAYSWKSVVEPIPSVGVPDMEPNEDIFGKSPTALLMTGAVGAGKVFKATGVDAYGRVAQRRFANAEIPFGAQLFKSFKMQLHKNTTRQVYDDLMNVTSRSATKAAEMKLLDIFVLALEYIKNAALKRMTVTEPLAAEDVTWVLTVPVCCGEPAKHFMRQAAKQAGFIRGGYDDENLVLCMEPVAACLALENRLSWRTNDKYLVIDCGGGTVDISAFRVVGVAPTGLEQLGEASGGPWGSTKVDKQFESYITDFVLTVAQDAGTMAQKSFFSSSALFRILQSWERAKTGLRSVDHDCRIDLSELSSEPLEVDMEAMDNGRKFKNQGGGGEEMVGGDGTWDLILRPALLRKFFTSSCDNIANAVSQQLDKPEMQGLASVVMVGGFSGSVHVQEAVKARVRLKYPGNEVDVAVPRSPDLAIVQGAAHYVSRPKQPSSGGIAAPQYKSIVSPTSYGILVSKPGGGALPPLFDPFFVKGEAYSISHVAKKVYAVKQNSPFTLAVGSCGSAQVQPGPNTLHDVGGFEALRQHEFTVRLPPVAIRTAASTTIFANCCSCRKSAISSVVAQDEMADISVEFSLNGIELHVRVKSSDDQVLLQQTVAFRDLRYAPPPAYGTI